MCVRLRSSKKSTTSGRHFEQTVFPLEMKYLVFVQTEEVKEAGYNK